MKIKRLDRDLWRRITKKRYIQQELSNDSFCGIISLLYIDEVSIASVWDFPTDALPSAQMVACDTGMKWLELLPYEGGYLITVMIGADGGINGWYIDMIAGYGIDTDGVAYIHDLYLDLIVSPDGGIKIDDMDELETALTDGTITKDLFDQAIAVKDMLLAGRLCDIERFRGDCMACLRAIETKQ